MTQKLKTAPVVLAIILGAGCAGPVPVEEMALARAALDAARDAGAVSISPGFWHKAEESYRKGQTSLKGNYNFDAKEQFEEAREFAEKAENTARLKKFQSGEGF